MQGIFYTPGEIAASASKLRNPGEQVEVGRSRASSIHSRKIAMKSHLYSLICGLLLLGSIQAQQPSPSNYQPFTPTVVGGLPPNARGLEQPVYVAERNDVPDPASGNSPSFSGDFNPNQIVPTLEQMNVFEPGKLIAAVGEERILVGDLIPPDKVTPQVIANGQLEMALRQMLVEAVTRKALAQRFINDKVSGKTLKERETARKTIESQTNKIFYEKFLPLKMQDLNCDSEQEFV
jgi:hypothetical protein